MSLEFDLTHCSCHVTTSIRNHVKKTEVACFLECVDRKIFHFESFENKLKNKNRYEAAACTIRHSCVQAFYMYQKLNFR